MRDRICHRALSRTWSAPTGVSIGVGALRKRDRRCWILIADEIRSYRQVCHIVVAVQAQPGLPLLQKVRTGNYPDFDLSQLAV